MDYKLKISLLLDFGKQRTCNKVAPKLKKIKKKPKN